jgi:Leucine-rich repeat (LRR) protein
LRASFNIIATLPAELGKLKRLRKLILNGNRIKVLPPEVGRLEMLEELVLSENSLEEIPSTVATMAMLRVLKVLPPFLDSYNLDPSLCLSDPKQRSEDDP